MKKYLPLVARVLLGLVFLILGFSKIVPFLPQMTEPPKAMGFLTGLMAAGYFIPMLGSIETICGALLLLNRFAPLALTILAPILVNILMFHAFLAPSGVPLVSILILLEIYLAHHHRAAFAPMLKLKPAA